MSILGNLRKVLENDLANEVSEHNALIYRTPDYKYDTMIFIHICNDLFVKIVLTYFNILI